MRLIAELRLLPVSRGSRVFAGCIMFFQRIPRLTFGLALLVVAAVNSRDKGATAGEVLVSTEEQLEAAVAAAAPGDVVVIQDGTRRDWSITLRAFGTHTQPVTLKAQTPGAVKLSGNVRVEISGSHLVVSGLLFQCAHSSRHASVVEFRGADHCRLTECSFLDCGDPNSTYTRTVNLAYGSCHCRVDHCYMRGTLSMGMGVVVRDSDAGRGNTDNRFDHNYFRDIERLSSNGQEPVQLGQDQTAFGAVSLRTVVEYNLFENASGDSEIISNKSADNIIRCNTLRDSKAGICLRGGRNVLVEGNYCHGTHGIRVYGDGHRIINNYLEETEGGISLDAGQYRAGEFVDRETSGSYQAASDVLVSHNTIVNPRGSGINLGQRRGQAHSGVERNQLPERIMFVNNLVTGQADVLVSDQGSRHVIWKSNIAWPTGEAKIGPLPPGVVALNPELVFQGVRYLPGATSFVKDAGTSAPEVTTDYSGVKRAGIPDIGCDEAVQGGIVRRPLRPTDVGPSWRGAESSQP